MGKKKVTYLFFTVLVLGAFFFSKRSHFDLATFSFLSFLFYQSGFILFGVARELAVDLDLTYGLYEISEMTYWVLIVVVAGIFLGGLFIKYQREPVEVFELDVKSEIFLFRYYQFLLVIFFVGMLASRPDILWMEDKTEALEAGGGLLVLLHSTFLCYSTAFVYFYAKKKTSRLDLLLTASCLTLFLLMSHRSILVLALLAAVLMVYDKREMAKIRLVRNSVLAIMLMALMAIAKPLAGYIVIQGFTGLWDYFTDMENFAVFMTGYEPVWYAYMLGTVIDSGFSTSPSYLLEALPQLFFPGALFGFKSSAFGDMMQEALFSDIDFGIGYTIIGEMHAAGGIFGVILLAIASAVLIALLQRFSQSLVGLPRALFYVLVAFGLFYVYRNSLAVSLVYVRNFLYVALSGILLGVVLGRMEFRLITATDKQHVE